MSGLFPSADPTGVWYRGRSLSLVIIAILRLADGLHPLRGSAVWLADGLDTARSPPSWVATPTCRSSLVELRVPAELVADTYGVLLIVLLSKWLRGVGSAESTDE
jgi:hypothetical protein